MKTKIIFDLDGTLALIDKRLRLATKSNGKLNWDEFFKPQNIQLDEPNVPIIETFKALKAQGYEMLIFSGRDEISRRETVAWLKEHGVDPDLLIMRTHGSFTPDDVLKKSWLDSIGGPAEVFCVFDDRDKVVKMWRDNGLTCCQVNYGDF